jgi:zinc transport system substrate-binding protein
MEPWVHNIIENNEINVLDASEGIELIKTELHEHEEEQEHKHGEYDPHVWLSPKNAIKQVENIRDKLIEIDPENEEYYTNNAKYYIEKLEELDNKITNEINSEKCKKSEVVITHATLAYFCRDYGLEQIALTGINPQAEISVKELTEIMEHIEGKNVTVIFTEEQINPQTAQVIAQELGIQTMTLNTIHGISDEDKKAGKNYITLMEDNISKLKIALECE